MVADRRIKRLLSERRSLMRALSVHRLHPLPIDKRTNYLILFYSYNSIISLY